MRATEGLLETAIRATLDAVVAINDEGLITIFNPAAERMFGYRAAEMIGQPVDRLMPEDSRAQHRQHVASYFALGQPRGAIGRVIELTGLRRDGAIFPMDVTLSAGTCQGRQFVVGVLRDISERKRTEAELARHRHRLEELVKERTDQLEESRARLRESERLAALGTLAAGIAHEINNPVGAILLTAGNCLHFRDRPDAEARAFTALESIASDAQRCGRIVRSVLQFARCGYSQKRPGDLAAVVAQAVERIQDYAQRRGAAVTLEAGAGWPAVCMNAVEMEQVFVNLLSNAIESRAEGAQVDVRIALAGRMLSVAVRDNGRGLDAEERKKVFDPFFTTRRAEGGVGLGLSIVHGVVAEHGGTVEMTSAPGQGATVTVNLPLAGNGQRPIDHAQAAHR